MKKDNGLSGEREWDMHRVNGVKAHKLTNRYIWEKYRKEFKKRVDIKRKEFNLTYVDLADELCVSEATIHRWMSGGLCCGVDNLIIMADYFDVSIDWLLGRDY